jgi:hypothetical protein
LLYRSRSEEFVFYSEARSFTPPELKIPQVEAEELDENDIAWNEYRRELDPWSTDPSQLDFPDSQENLDNLLVKHGCLDWESI